MRRHADAKSLREKNYPEPSTYHALSWAAPTPVLFTGMPLTCLGLRLFAQNLQNVSFTDKVVQSAPGQLE